MNPLPHLRFAQQYRDPIIGRDLQPGARTEHLRCRILPQGQDLEARRRGGYGQGKTRSAQKLSSIDGVFHEFLTSWAACRMAVLMRV